MFYSKEILSNTKRDFISKLPYMLHYRFTAHINVSVRKKFNRKPFTGTSF